MKHQNENWSLFRLSDRKQFDNVTLEMIEFFFRTGTEKTRIDWLMWREGFTGWRPFGELSQILKHLQTEDKVLPTPPPVPESVLKYAEESTGLKRKFEKTATKTISDRAIDAATSSLRIANSGPKVIQHAQLHDDSAEVLTLGNEATLSLMLESQAATEDRDNVRYQKNFKVRIFTPKGVVSLETVDCSTAGFRLNQPLPVGLARFFHCELDLGPDGKIPLVCSEVREKGANKTTRVRIQVNDHMNKLKSVLLRAV